ncbi:MAG: hypothetical protein QW622_02875 [Candidatus Pacearchaeota archaeon]
MRIKARLSTEQMKNNKTRHKKHKFEKNLLARREEWRGHGKRGFELSFTFLFSLILIAVFIFVAIWAIKNFLELKDSTMIRTSINDINTVVIEVWQAEEAQRIETFIFPTTVTQICFANLSQLKTSTDLDPYKSLYKNTDKNLFVLPFKLRNKYNLEGAYAIKCGEVNCLNFTTPTCFNVVKGKVTLTFVGMPEGKVRISK